MQINNYLIQDRDCVKSQIFQSIKEIFPKFQNKNDKKNIKNIFKVIKGFIVSRRSVQKNIDFTVKKKKLGVMIKFYSKKNEQNKTYIQIKRTSLDQLQIFSKKFFEGLDIFYFFLFGIYENDEIFSEIRKEFYNMFSLLESVGKYYYQKNQHQHEKDQKDWKSFKTNIQLYFNKDEMLNLIRILIFCTVLYFEDQRETSENQKKTQITENKNNAQNSENDSQESEDDISTADFISTEPSLDELSKIIQTNWEVQSERPSVNSFKIVKRNEHGVCIYLFTQLVNLIFQKIENKFEIQDWRLYQKIIQNQNISFYLVSDMSVGGGLPELLQEMIRTMVLQPEQSAEILKQMSELHKQNKFNLEIQKVRDILKCKDARLDFIKFNGHKFEIKDFQLGYQTSLSILVQQLLRTNTRNQLIKSFNDLKIQSSIEIALDLAEYISRFEFMNLETDSQKTNGQYKKHYKNAIIQNNENVIQKQ